MMEEARLRLLASTVALELVRRSTPIATGRYVLFDGIEEKTVTCEMYLYNYPSTDAFVVLYYRNHRVEVENLDHLRAKSLDRIDLLRALDDLVHMAIAKRGE